MLVADKTLVTSLLVCVAKTLEMEVILWPAGREQQVANGYGGLGHEENCFI